MMAREFPIPTNHESICGFFATICPFIASLGCISGGLYNIILSGDETYYVVLGFIYLIVGLCLPVFLCYQMGQRQVVLHEDVNEVYYVETLCCGGMQPKRSYLGKYVPKVAAVVPHESQSQPAGGVQQWMADTVKLPQYTDKLLENGFNSVELLRYTSDDDLDKLMNMLNITEQEHRGRLKEEVSKLKQ